MLYDMVFEGGGAKGTVFVGAMQELQKRGHMPGRLLGTSAGSIMATLLAAGYQIDEMGQALSEKKNGQPVFLGFLQTPPPLTQDQINHSTVRDLLRNVNVKLIPDFLENQMDNAIAEALANSAYTSRIFSFLELGGFYAADTFLTWLRDKLNSGVYPLERGTHKKGTPRNFGGMNLTEFFEATGVDLSVVAANTRDREMLILNHRTAPDLPVAWAVRMSMSLPLVWQEVVWQPEWGKYRGVDVSGCTVVDGGLLSNFPIELFLSDQPQVTGVMGEMVAGKQMVLGFLIDESLDVPGAPPLPAKASTFEIGQLRPVTRVTNLVNTMLQAHDKNVIESFERFVIHLPAKGYGTIEFDMSDERRNALIAAGQQATAAYFDRLEAGAAFGVGEAVDETVSSAADRIAGKILSR
jgi:NTE family protein